MGEVNVDVYETKGDSQGKNSEGEEGEAEKARSVSFLIESTCFEIQHDGIELCV